MKRSLLLLAFVALCFPVIAQHTIKLDGKASPKASLKDVAWIAGSWKGEAFGGITEEVWTAPLGDSMMGSFKLVVDGKVQFYELCQIREENGSLVLRLKHFNGDLTAWEEKNETVDFLLVKLEKDAAYFEDFTVQRISKNQINMYVMVSNEGEESEVEFKYYRQDKN